MNKSLLLSIIAAAAVAPLSAQNSTAPITATFEDLNLPLNSFWNGSENGPEYSEGTFKSGSFEFNNTYNQEYKSWGFFAYASMQENTYSNLTDQYRNCVGGGYESDTYGLACISTYLGNTVMTPVGDSEGCELDGFWVVNSAWVMSCIENGDGLSDAFADGDYLRLTLTGEDAKGNKSTVDYYLADFRNNSNYVCDKWTWVDLKPLGKVKSVVFDMESTKRNDFGITTPLYFCFDNVTPLDKSAVMETAETPVKIVTANGNVTVYSAENRFKATIYNMEGRKLAEAATAEGALTLTPEATGLLLLTLESNGCVVSRKVIL